MMVLEMRNLQNFKIPFLLPKLSAISMETSGTCWTLQPKVLYIFLPRYFLNF
jgi:hypothetical protein